MKTVMTIVLRMLENPSSRRMGSPIEKGSSHWNLGPAKGYCRYMKRKIEKPKSAHFIPGYHPPTLKVSSKSVHGFLSYALVKF